MSFDTSRFLFDPTRDYLGVVMQQGRVQLDADWNEWLLELSRRLQAGTLDLVGRAGVPAGTPSGFKINAFVDAAGPHLTIGAGRIYVDGLVAENHGPATTQSLWDPALAELSAAPQLPGVAEVDVDYTLQPYLPGATLTPTQLNHQFLVYLDVWQRDLTSLQDPTLIDPAVGIDTTARRQTVWQVKLLDVTNLGFTAATPEAQIPGRLTIDPAVIPWANLIQPSGSLLTNGTEGAQIIAPTACALSPTTGYTGLENQLYRVEIHQANSAAGTATFKWSRENASIVTLVTAIATLTTGGTSQSQLTVQSLGRDQVLGFNPGDWLEITDDVLELSGQSGELHRILAIDPHARTVTLDSAVATASFPLSSGLTLPARHTRILRWDQAGTVFLADGSAPVIDLDTTGSAGIPVPPPGTSLLLESGITVAFDLSPAGGFFQPGDFWTFAARTADSSVQPLTKAPPQGPFHHLTRLATVDFSANPPAVVDLRRSIPALASPALHVTNVIVGGSPLVNDATLTIQSLVSNGISIVCDAPLDPAIITHPNLLPRNAPTGAVPSTQPNNPICWVTLDLPSAANGGAFTRATLPSVVSVGPPNTLQWKPALSSTSANPPTPSPLTLLENQIPLAGPAVLARLTLKGNAIWASANPSIFLNGANNGRPSADYELWFWLISQPVATLSTTSLAFGQQSVSTASSAQTVFLINNGSAPLTISAISVPPPFVQTPAITVPQQLAAGVSLPIPITFNPTAAVQSTAQMSITESDPNTSPLLVNLSGIGIAPSLAASVASLAFPTNTIVNATTAPQTIRLTSNGSSQVTITAIAIVGLPGTLVNYFILGNLPPTPFVLQPNAFADIQVSFKSLGFSGNFAAQVSVTSTAAGSPLLIPITAGAILGAPVITPSANALSFNSILINTSTTLTIAFTNTGNANLTISGVTTVGGQATLFTPALNLATLAPNQVATVTVTFRPLAIGSFSTTLQIVHNAANSPLNIPISGAGFKPVKVTKESKEGKDGKENFAEKINASERKAVTIERVQEFRPAILTAPAVDAEATHAATQHAFITQQERPDVGPAPEPPTPPAPATPAPAAPIPAPATPPAPTPRSRTTKLKNPAPSDPPPSGANAEDAPPQGLAPQEPGKDEPKPQ